jgi:hypothetical protein
MPNNNANNHHHQYDKAQGRSNSPAACDQQQPHQQQSQPQAHQQHHQQHGKGQGYYNYHYPPNGLGSYNNGHANYQNGNPQQQRPPFRRGGPHRYGSNSHPHSNGGGSHGYGRANSWTNGSYNNTGNGACDAPKSHGIEKKIFNDGKSPKLIDSIPLPFICAFLLRVLVGIHRRIYPSIYPLYYPSVAAADQLVMDSIISRPGNISIPADRPGFGGGVSSNPASGSIESGID